MISTALGNVSEALQTIPCRPVCMPQAHMPNAPAFAALTTAGRCAVLCYAMWQGLTQAVQGASSSQDSDGTATWPLVGTHTLMLGNVDHLAAHLAVGQRRSSYTPRGTGNGTEASDLNELE